MPLFELDGRKVVKVPYETDFGIYRARLSDAEWDAIVEWVNTQIDGHEVRTAGWLPPAKWQGTPLFAIYMNCARQNFDLAGRCFGLIVYVVFMNRPEDWFSGRFELNGRDIGSRTYFQRR